MNRIGLSVLAGLALAAAPAFAQETLSGTVSFEGKAKKNRKSPVDADKYCSNIYPDGIESEDFVLGEGQKLGNVFVYVKKGAKGPFDTPKNEAVLDQQGCRYIPHVIGVMVNQPILIKNSDDTNHNVHAQPKLNKDFNESQPQKGMEKKATFSMPELSIKVKCEVHPWMAAWIHVVDNPYFAVTDKSGKYEIKNLPPGEYEVEFVHEKLGTVTQSVKVEKGGKPVDVAFQDKK